MRSREPAGGTWRTVRVPIIIAALAIGLYFVYPLGTCLAAGHHLAENQFAFVLADGTVSTGGTGTWSIDNVILLGPQAPVGGVPGWCVAGNREGILGLGLLAVGGWLGLAARRGRGGQVGGQDGTLAPH